MKPPKYGFEVTFDVGGGEPMLICVSADDADEAVASAREQISEVGYGDLPVIKIERY